jgi:hypothetical protein
MTQSNRSVWDIGRFFQTLTFFDALPLVRELKSMFFSPPPPPQPANLQADLIFDFQRDAEVGIRAWGSLDDVVMGGVSESSLSLTDGGALFSGRVSTDNSGGFVSVRSRNFEPVLDLSRYSGIELYLQGDGQRYKFFIRDSEGWDSVAYSYAFDTVADEWMAIKIPFSEMVPVFRAKSVRDAPPLQRDRLRSFQLMLSKFEWDGALNPRFRTGAFRLTVQSIKAYH